VAAPGAFEPAMLEAFRSLFHRSGYHSHLTLAAARAGDRQKLRIGCFPHGQPLADFGNLNQNSVAPADAADSTIRHPIGGSTQTPVPDYHV
jgi:hypothetical protein